jgi:hypothetical protein
MTVVALGISGSQKSFRSDQTTEKMIEDKLKEHDFEGARKIALKEFGVFRLDEPLQKIFNACMSQDNLAEAKKTALEMVSIVEKDGNLEKVLDKELEKGEFSNALKTCELLLSKSAVKKAAQKIKNANLDLASLKEIEDNLPLFVFFPQFRIIILKVLSGLYEALGKNLDADRLKKEIVYIKSIAGLNLYNFKGPFLYEHQPSIEPALAPLSGLCMGLGVAELTGSVALGSVAGVGTAVGVLYPRARRLENVAGFAAGVAAATIMNVAAPSALGIGLGVAAAARIPLVRSTALGFVNMTGSIAGVAVEVAVDVAQGTTNLTVQAVQGVASGIIKVGSLALNVLGSVVAAVDSALDTVTFQK